MTEQDHISKELKELNSSLPYPASPPTGAPSSSPGSPGGMTVPVGFFDGFATDMLQKVRGLEVSEELKNLSPVLADLARDNPYQVPPLYFSELDPMIVTADETNSGLSPLLSGLKKENPFTVPDHYFEGLNATSFQNVSDDALHVADFPVSVDQSSREKGEDVFSGDYVSTLLKTPPVNPYTVPTGYFATLDPMKAVKEENALGFTNMRAESRKTKLPEVSNANFGDEKTELADVPNVNVQDGQTAKVVTMSSFKWMRYAAAAAVITFISASAFFFINRNTSTSDVEIARTMKDVSTDAINEVIDLADAESVYALNDKDKTDISKLMQDVPEKEIQDFLNETESLGSDTEEDPLLN